MLAGRYGVRNGQYALKVEHINEHHAVREAGMAIQSSSSAGADLAMPLQAQADLVSAADAMNQLADQIQRNEGAL